MVLLASGGMTHRFFHFQELRQRESQKAPDNIYDREVLRRRHGGCSRCCGKGDHAGVIDWMPEYRKAAPRGTSGTT